MTGTDSGTSTATSAAVGRLAGVGLGPGDPELVTVKAARLVAAADVVAFHSGPHGRSIARRIADPYVRPGTIEEPLVYPVTTGTTEHPEGYEGAVRDFYDVVAARLAAHLDAGRDVVVLCEGDPMFYGSYMYAHERLAHRYETVVVPGVTSVSAAAAALGRPLVQRDEVLTVLPGTLPRAQLARHLAAADAAAVLKLGRTFEGVRGAVEDAGRGPAAWYVERASTDAERTAPLRDVDPADVPYFSLALVPSPAAAARTSRTADLIPDVPTPGYLWTSSDLSKGPEVPTSRDPGTAAGEGERGEVVVVGLGPGGAQWLTPEAAQALAAADDLVGYRTYLDRVPAAARRPGQVVHASGNTVEAERADFALSLARAGRRVAVVSGGDPGVFAMAAAVVEQAGQSRWDGVPVRVLPGVTAAQAVAARAGAPLGHDHAVVSLSDRLKPWEVVAARLDALGAADLAVALYNPRSRARPWQLGAALDVLRRHRDPATPVVLGRDVGGPAEQVAVVTLADLTGPALDAVDMRCLVVVGSSRTVRTPSGQVVTPRSYPGTEPEERHESAGVAGESAV